MEIRTNGEVSIFANAAPQAVYDLVSDVTRTGQWSPECHRCEWTAGPPRQTGTRFRGWNKSGVFRWSRICEVTSAQPNREFVFRTVPRGIARDSTSWQYQLAPEGTGTRITLRYDFLEPPRFPVPMMVHLFLHHHADMRPHMTQTLENIKHIAEREAAHGPGPAPAP